MIILRDRRLQRRNYILAIFLLICAMPLPSNQISAAERPLIFLPGILGSKLYSSDDAIYDSSDELLWGDRGSYSRFLELNLAENDNIIAHDIIDSIRILGPFKINQYNGLLDHLIDLGYQRDQDLFVFAYDWRKSNFTSAAALNLYLESCKVVQNQCEELATQDFDILAHSMGGLVARIFMENYAENGSRVSNFITLGAPFRGSLAATESLLSGFSGLSRIVSGSQEDVRAVMLSFESGFELSPTYSDCCFIGESWLTARGLDLNMAESWDMLIPSNLNPVEWRSHIEAGIRRRNQLINIVTSPVPSGTSFYPIVSSNIRTKSAFLFQSSTGETQWNYSRGDGTVPSISATNGNSAQSRVSMAKHSHIFDDNYVEESLRRILVDRNELIPFSDDIVNCNSNNSESCFYVGATLVKAANVDIEPSIGMIDNSLEIQFVLQVDTTIGQQITPDDLAASPEMCIYDMGIDSDECTSRTVMLLRDISDEGLATYTAEAYNETDGDFKVSVFNEDDLILSEYYSIVGEGQ